MTTNTITIDLPVRFSGTAEESAANFRTHAFAWDDDGDTRCMNCDCRPSHAAASYPCGTEPPRQIVTVAR
jgi:hypothetical protein